IRSEIWQCAPSAPLRLLGTRPIEFKVLTDILTMRYFPRERPRLGCAVIRNMISRPRSRLHSRAILIFLITIVAPVAILLWLGLQSFERQRAAYESLRADNLRPAIEPETHRV